MYPDLEDLAKDAAKYYHKMVDKDKVMLFCEKILYFQVQVKQRDCLYEIQNFIGSVRDDQCHKCCWLFYI